MVQYLYLVLVVLGTVTYCIGIVSFSIVAYSSGYVLLGTVLSYTGIIYSSIV